MPPASLPAAVTRTAEPAGCSAVAGMLVVVYVGRLVGVIQRNSREDNNSSTLFLLMFLFIQGLLLVHG